MLFKSRSHVTDCEYSSKEALLFLTASVRNEISEYNYIVESSFFCFKQVLNFVSVNKTQMVGTTIQRDLFSGLLQFMMKNFAIRADFTKMYRPVRDHKYDCIFQLIIWRESPEMRIQIYELNTVSYGTAPALFLAVRCLNEISEIFKDVFSLDGSLVPNDFYVDDLISGADDGKKSSIF